MKKKIINWIKKQLKDASAKGIVFGLSGGVDSAVVGALSRLAAGKDKALALFLPCHSNPRDFKDARLAAKKFGLKTKTIDLSDTYDRLLKIFPKGNKIALANLKPRLRMLTLYYHANKLNYLVAGTGNKSELMVGYFTKHGDGATDILPIGCLLKKDVVKLARELGVPERIITKPPSAGLWGGQTDEAEMGISYKQLDDILERLEGNKKQVAAKVMVNKVKAMIKGSEHKRQGPRACNL